MSLNLNTLFKHNLQHQPANIYQTLRRTLKDSLICDIFSLNLQQYTNETNKKTNNKQKRRCQNFLRHINGRRNIALVFELFFCCFYFCLAIANLFLVVFKYIFFLMLLTLQTRERIDVQFAVANDLNWNFRTSFFVFCVIDQNFLATDHVFL